MQIDIQPEAREIAQQAAHIFAQYLDDDLLRVVAHGSCVKGSFIPGCSDIDLVVIVKPEALTNGGQLTLETVLAIHSSLSAVDIRHFRYIQPVVEGHGGPTAHTFVPGAYSA